MNPLFLPIPEPSTHIQFFSNPVNSPFKRYPESNLFSEVLPTTSNLQSSLAQPAGMASYLICLFSLLSSQFSTQQARGTFPNINQIILDTQSQANLKGNWKTQPPVSSWPHHRKPGAISLKLCYVPSLANRKKKGGREVLLWELINSRTLPDHLGSSPHFLMQPEQITSQQAAANARKTAE